MKKDNSPKKNEPKKNDVRKYLNCILLMVALILITLIASKLYKNHQENKLGTSIFSRTVGTIQLDDIDSMKNEMPTNAFILISYTKKEDVKKLETNLKKIVINNDLQDSFYYLDATDLMDNKDFINSINQKFDLDEANKIESLPALLYFQEGSFKRSITSTKDRQMTADDFNRLLDNYEILND